MVSAMNTHPVIILVNPQMGENIGAAARAMLNCGLDRLRLVAPRDGWPSATAAAMSSGALDKMPPVEVFASLAEAAHDCHHLYATTARPRDMVKPVLTAREAASDCRARDNQQCAFVFGAERAGLANDDVALCQSIITIPVNPDFWSLNLAQCVLLCAYEWFQAPTSPSNPPTSGGRRAAQGEEIPASLSNLTALYDRLETELQTHGFFRTQELRPNVMRNLKNMLGRAEMTEQEVNTFHGIITALIKKDQ